MERESEREKEIVKDGEVMEEKEEESKEEEREVVREGEGLTVCGRVKEAIRIRRSDGKRVSFQEEEEGMGIGHEKEGKSEGEKERKKERGREKGRHESEEETASGSFHFESDLSPLLRDDANLTKSLRKSSRDRKRQFTSSTRSLLLYSLSFSLSGEEKEKEEERVRESERERDEEEAARGGYELYDSLGFRIVDMAALEEMDEDRRREIRCVCVRDLKCFF